MEAASPTAQVRYRRWLPYWAVFQADVRQTLCSWVYRVWVLVSVLVAVGYLLYSRGAAQEAGIIQPASLLISDLLRWTLFGSVTLIIVLTTGSISAERGTLADSVLCRGISRYQYFLGKWHARLATVLGTFVVMGTAALIGSVVLLHEDLSPAGSAIALFAVVAMLAAVVSCGVTVSAISNNTLLGIVFLWLTLYGAGFVLTLLPESVPSPDRILHRLPHVLRGHYDLVSIARLGAWSLLGSFLVALIGMIAFSRRDV